MFNNWQKNDPLQYGYSGQMMHGNPFESYWNRGWGRNQPFPLSPIPNANWYSYQQQYPYFQQPYQPIPPAYQPNAPHPSYMTTASKQMDSEALFKNPLQPKEEQNPYQPNFQPMNGFPSFNPYPKQNTVINQPGGMQSILNSFKSQDGTVDFNKMMNTAGQMMSAVNQVTMLVKGLGGMFKFK